MSLYTKTSFTIGDHQFTSFHALQLSQTIRGHHVFEITIGYDWLAKLGNGLFASGKGFLGKEISITITPVEPQRSMKPFTFNGIVTGISMGKESEGTHGFCVIKGSSPTVLLEDDENIACFEKQSLTTIVTDALKACSPFSRSPQVNPETSGNLKYIVQYRETTWQFIERLASRYGEWFFYNGEKMVFGKYQPVKTTLTHQLDLVDFKLDLTVVANNRKLSGYDYRQTQVVENTTDTAAGGMNPYSSHLKDVSKRLYGKTSLYKVNHGFASDAKSELDKFTAVQQKSRLAQMAVLKGTSKNTSLRIGDIVSVDESLFSKEHHGEFVVTRLEHTCTENGLYLNHFEAIPADTAMPVVDLDNIPVCEPQSAVVTENHDPKGLGRVRVKFRWQASGSTPWIRLIASHGGSGKGFYFIPEVGEEVWVDFEGGNPEAPYVLGTTYNGNAKTNFGDSANNIKAIKTRSGHVIRLDDSSGSESITITDKAGNIITLDTAGKNISISAPETITVNAKNISISAQQNISVNAGDNITQRAAKDFKLYAANITEIADDTMQRTAKSMQKTAEQMKMTSTKADIEFHSSKQIINKSGDKAKLF